MTGLWQSVHDFNNTIWKCIFIIQPRHNIMSVIQHRISSNVVIFPFTTTEVIVRIHTKRFRETYPFVIFTFIYFCCYRCVDFTSETDFHRRSCASWLRDRRSTWPRAALAPWQTPYPPRVWYNLCDACWRHISTDTAAWTNLCFLGLQVKSVMLMTMPIRLVSSCCASSWVIVL